MRDRSIQTLWSTNGKSQAGKLSAACASGAARVQAAERPRAAHALAPPSRWRLGDAIFGKEDRKEIGLMRIITCVGIRAGGCLLVLFFYLVLARRGVFSDRDSALARAAMRGARC